MRLTLALVAGVVVLFTARHAFELAMAFLAFYIVYHGYRSPDAV